MARTDWLVKLRISCAIYLRATLVEAHLDGEWSRVGYIQKEKNQKSDCSYKEQ